MGLDATIRRADGQSLGDIETVQRALASLYPGVELGLEPSGLDKIRAAAARGIVYPEGLAETLAELPATYVGLFEGDGYFVELALGAGPLVDAVHVVFRGDTSKSQPMEARLREEYGWTITFP